MSLNIITVVDRSSTSRPLVPIIVAQDTTTIIFDDITTRGDFDQIVTRKVSNAGATDMYYAYGEDCKPPLGNSPGIFNGLLPSKQTLTLDTLQRFTVYCVGAASIAGRTEVIRNSAIRPSGVLTDNIQ